MLKFYHIYLSCISFSELSGSKLQANMMSLTLKCFSLCFLKIRILLHDYSAVIKIGKLTLLLLLCGPVVGKYRWPSILVNKALLEHNHTDVLWCVSGCSLPTKVGLN